MGVVLPGANSLTVLLPVVGHVEVAAGVERQGLGIIQPGEGGGGRGAPRCELAHRVIAVLLATKRLPLESNARASGSFSPVRVAVGVVLPGANSLTVLSHRSWPRRGCRWSRTPGPRDHSAR